MGALGDGAYAGNQGLLNVSNEDLNNALHAIGWYFVRKSATHFVEKISWAIRRNNCGRFPHGMLPYYASVLQRSEERDKIQAEEDRKKREAHYEFLGSLEVWSVFGFPAQRSRKKL